MLAVALPADKWLHVDQYISFTSSVRLHVSHAVMLMMLVRQRVPPCRRDVLAQARNRRAALSPYVVLALETVTASVLDKSNSS